MSIRTQRVGHEIQRIIGELLDTGVIHDPRLSGMVSVTGVKVTGDLRTARVFYSCFGSSEDVENTAKALKSASGFIQSEVGERLGIKYIPKLVFIRDDSIAYGDHIERAIESLEDVETES